MKSNFTKSMHLLICEYTKRWSSFHVNQAGMMIQIGKPNFSMEAFLGRLLITNTTKAFSLGQNGTCDRNGITFEDSDFTLDT